VKNTIALAASKFYEKGIMFFFFMFLARKYGSASFGEFSYYFTVASILFVFFDIGGEFYQIREFTKGESIRKFQSLFLLKTLIAILVFFVCVLSQQPVGLLILVGAFYLDSIISIYKSSLYKNNMFYIETVLTFIEKTTLAFLVLLNFVFIDRLLFMYVCLVVGKITYLLFATKTYYKVSWLFKSFKVLNISFFKEYIMNSWSYVLHALLVVVFVQIDIVMLKKMGISFKEIGIYNAAVKIYFTVIVFADVLFKQYYPKVAKLIKEGKKGSLRDLIMKIQSVNVYLSVVISLMTMLFSNEIIWLVFGGDFNKSSKILVLLSILIIFRFSMYTYTAILSSSDLNYIKLFTSLTCVFINVGLNFFLIPRYGVYGALSATVVTEFFLVTLYKLSSLKIVFTNYVTKKELLALGSSLFTGYYLFFNSIDLKYKIIILILLFCLIFINRIKIKKSLVF